MAERDKNLRLVFAACGLVLLAAALLKLSGVVEAYWSPGWLMNQFGANAIFTVVVSLLEIVLSLWLLSGFKPDFAARAAIMCFGLFAVVSLYHILRGTKSCGCFGPAATSPWLSLGIDLAALAALLAIRYWQMIQRLKIRHVLPSGLSLVLLVLVVLGPGQSLLRQSALLMAAMQPASENGVNLLEPEKWKGEKLPLLKDLSIAAKISHGSWIVIFYRPDCDTCRQVVAEYLALNESAARSSTAHNPGNLNNLAFVSITTNSPGMPKKIPGTQNYPNCMLDGNTFEIMPTPVAVDLKDGMVQNVSLNDEAEGGWLEKK